LVVLNWRKIQAFSLIALIVLFFSGGPGISNLENDVRALCSEVSDLKKSSGRTDQGNTTVKGEARTGSKRRIKKTMGSGL
jgi:hypothetical protein